VAGLTMPRRHRHRSRLGLIAVCLVLALGAAAAAGWMFGEPMVRARVTAAVQRATGRTLVIAAPLSLWPGRELVAAAENVSLSNAPGVTPPEMMRLHRIEAHVAWWPLLERRLVIDRLVLAQSSTELERGQDGFGNWQFSPPPRTASPAAPEGPRPGRGWAISIHSVELVDADIHLRDARLGQNLEVRFLRLVLAAAADDAPISIDGDFVLGPAPTHITGQLGSALAFVAASEATPWPLRIEAAEGSRHLSVAGMIARPREARGYDLAIDLGVPDLSGLSGVAGRTLPALRDFSAMARLVDAGRALPEIRDLKLHAGASEFAVPGQGAFHLDRFDLAMPRITSPVEATLDGSLAGTPVRLAASVGALENLIMGRVGPPLPVDIRAEAGGATARISGAVARPPSFAGIDLTVNAAIPDLAALSSLAGRQLPGFTALTVAGRVIDQSGPAAPELAVRNIAVSGPQGDLSGSIGWRLALVPEVTAELSSTRLDIDAIRAVLAALPQPSLPSTPASPAFAQGRLIPETDLPWAQLASINGEARWRIGELRLAGINLAEFVGHATLRDGKLVVDPLGGQGASGRIDIMASVEARAAEPPVSLVAHGNGVALKPLLAAFGLPDNVAADADVSIDLHAQGRTPRALAASAAGHVAVAVADGEIDNAMLSAALGNALRAARLPAEFGQGKTGVKCLAVRLDATRGVVSLTTLLLDTNRLLLQGTGDIDLSSEHLALRVRPLLRVGGPGLVVPVRIGGTLREPKAVLDSGGMLGALMGGERRNADACAPALASARRP